MYPNQANHHSVYGVFGAELTLEAAPKTPRVVPPPPSGPTPEQIREQAELRAKAAAQEKSMADLNVWLSNGMKTGKVPFELVRGLNFVPSSARPGFNFFFVDAMEQSDGLPFVTTLEVGGTKEGYVEQSSPGRVNLYQEVAKGKAVLFGERVPKGPEDKATKMKFVVTSDPSVVAKYAQLGGGFGIAVIPAAIQAEAERRLSTVAPAKSAPAESASKVSKLQAANMALSYGSSILGIYHGYKRNDSIGWAIGWGFVGAFWPIALPVMFAQGFGKPAFKTVAVANRRRGRRKPSR